MAKSPDAFRTISEVATALDTPAHVLRFWESKFSQIKPVKRAGGRRYYRPEDVMLLAGIKTLLHEQGMTIKGAQKLLREQGVKAVQAIGSGETPEPALAKKAEKPEKPKPAKDTKETVAPAAPEKPAEPTLEISNITAFRPRAPEQRALDLPPNPDMDEKKPARFFGAAPRQSEDQIRANAKQIAPLLARLEAARDQMRRT